MFISRRNRIHVKNCYLLEIKKENIFNVIILGHHKIQQTGNKKKHANLNIHYKKKKASRQTVVISNLNGPRSAYAVAQEIGHDIRVLDHAIVAGDFKRTANL